MGKCGQQIFLRNARVGIEFGIPVACQLLWQKSQWAILLRSKRMSLYL
jgi:hypothetical protein